MTASTIGIPSPVLTLPCVAVLCATLGSTPAPVEVDDLFLRSSKAVAQKAVISMTALSECAPFLVSERPEDEAIRQVADFLALTEGWDGENAARPKNESVSDAIAFLQLAGTLAPKLEPTLHVDGSVLLEVESGSKGALYFPGNGSVSYALAGLPPQNVVLTGTSIPKEIADYLRT